MIRIAAGLVVLAVAWFGPPGAQATESFAAHMTMHVSVVAVAAPLLAAGLLRVAVPTAWLAGLAAAPVVASVAEFVAVWGWHLPAMHHFARHSPAGLVLEQGSFLVTALWLWTAALARPAGREDPAGAGVFALLLTSMHMVLLGTLLTLAPRSLYHGGGTLDDTRIGGLVMLAGGGLPYLLGGLVLVWRLLDDAGRQMLPRAGAAAGRRVRGVDDAP